MKINKKIANTLVLTLALVLLFPSMSHGRQISIEKNASLPLLLNDSSGSMEKYGSNVFCFTNSGENWKSYTFGYYVYVFGKSKFQENGSDPERIANAENACNPTNVRKSSESGGLMFSKENSDSFKPVSAISYLIKITNYINLRFSTKNGKTTCKVSKGKLTEGIYSIMVENSSLERTLYYYKLENENGTKTRSLFI